MTTSLELAFARARWETLIPTAPLEKVTDRAKHVLVVVNNVRCTLRDLIDGKVYPIGDIDRNALLRATPYITFPKRKYREENGELWYYNSANKRKRIEHRWYSPRELWSLHQIDRELVVILKGFNDLFTVEAYTIKHMRNLLIRLLSDDQSHWTSLYLRNPENRKAAIAIHTRIEDALHRNVRDLYLELDAKLFYEKVTSDLGFTELDHQVIRALSWEWKDRPLYRDHPYACRSWDIIACLFSLTKGE